MWSWHDIAPRWLFARRPLRPQVDKGRMNGFALGVVALRLFPKRIRDF